MSLTSLFLDMKNKKVLIVGTGEVGIRRARRFIKTGAQVYIVTKNIDDEIKQEFESQGAKFYKPIHTDVLIETCDLIVAATDDMKINDEIAKKAEDKLINCASNIKLSNVIVPSTFKIGTVTISLYTGSKSPLMAKKLRKKIQKTITPTDILNIELQEHLRNPLKNTIPTQSERKKFMQKITEDKKIQKYLEDEKLDDACKYANKLLTNYTK